MSNYIIVQPGELIHHGINGQKWGKKNGPPYPLDAEDHSASERKAGWRKSLDKTDNATKKKSSKSNIEIKKEPGDNDNSDVIVVRNKKNKETASIMTMVTDDKYKDTAWAALATYPDHRNQGYGTETMDAGLKYLKENGYRKVNVIIPRKNKEGQRFVEKNGFKRIPGGLLIQRYNKWL